MAGRGRFKLAIQVDDKLEDTITNMESTYRKEGLSINYNGIRVDGDYLQQVTHDDVI